MQRRFYSPSPEAHELGTTLAALRIRQRFCQDRAQRDSAATPRDPCADPLCRENSLRGADWRNERQNYGAAAQRKPGVCHKCAPNVAQTWPFCSVVYTTARTFPRGACWRVAEAAPPREGFFEFVARPPGSAAGAPLPVEDLGGFAALAGARCLLGRLRPTWRPCWLSWPRWPCCASWPGTTQREACVRRRAAFGRGLAARPGHRPRCAPVLPAYRCGYEGKLAKGRRWRRIRLQSGAESGNWVTENPKMRQPKS